MMTKYKNERYSEKTIETIFQNTLQKWSGTEMATVSYLAYFSSWLMVNQLQMPEEQVNW